MPLSVEHVTELQGNGYHERILMTEVRHADLIPPFLVIQEDKYHIYLPFCHPSGRCHPLAFTVLYV